MRDTNTFNQLEREAENFLDDKGWFTDRERKMQSYTEGHAAADRKWRKLIKKILPQRAKEIIDTFDRM
jgi:hypothetical protein